MKIFPIALAAISLAGPAWSQAEKQPAPHTVDLQKYVEAAGGADLLEVKASQLALQRSQEPAIRQFAQQMVSEHTDSTNKLKAELGKAKLDIAPPEKLDAEKQAMLDTLMNVGTDEFNKMYMSLQISGHQQALELHEQFSQSGTDSFRAFARAMTTHVKDHLEQAKRIDATLPARAK